jgi:hypothetical protein
MGFKFFWNAKNSLVLDYGFNENRQIATKTDRYSVFLGRDPNIPDRLYVSYLSFYGFLKKSNFRSISISVSLRFWPKITSLWQKLTETPYFLVVTPIFLTGYT